MGLNLPSRGQLHPAPGEAVLDAFEQLMHRVDRGRVQTAIPAAWPDAHAHWKL